MEWVFQRFSLVNFETKICLNCEVKRCLYVSWGLLFEWEDYHYVYMYWVCGILEVSSL